MTTITGTANRVALVLAACLAGAAVGASPAAAQRPLVTRQIDSGTVVRLRLRDGTLEGARLLVPFARDSSAFSFCRWPANPCTLGGERHVVRPAAEVTGIDVHRGSQWRLGGVLGALAGVPLGFAFIEIAEGMGEHSLTGSERSRAIVGSVIGNALFGMMFGEFFQRWGLAP